jgi:formylglycine-generating enzyme required for sulfatase activity
MRAWTYTLLLAALLLGCGLPEPPRIGYDCAAPPEPAAATPPAAQDPRCPAGMVYVAGGTATPWGEYDSVFEEPRAIPAFCVDRLEVTVARYARCVEAGACDEPARGGACNWGCGAHAAHPINCVDRAQAAACCRHEGARLPEGHEWIWAAQGREATLPHPWGAARPDQQPCWRRHDHEARLSQGTCVAGSHPVDRSRDGALDLAGNVHEWTASPWKEHYPEAQVRGGAWSTDPRYGNLRTSTRFRFSEERREPHLGFRCGADPSTHR